jgi:hypothetical protein
MIVDRSKSLDEEYARLAILERTLRLAIAGGDIKCLNCGNKKSEHLYEENRCNTFVTSTFFRCNEVKQLADVGRALEHIEALQKL